jgi:hypothetical protein
MKTTINYIAISKNKSLKFDKIDYIINYDGSGNSLITGKKLCYGYLTNSTILGAKRGWFVTTFSMTNDDFCNRYDFVEGCLNIKINLVK